MEACSEHSEEQCGVCIKAVVQKLETDRVSEKVREGFSFIL